MKTPTNINHAPADATHWAPETDDWLEAYYRHENGLWYCVSDYWASDVDERPYGMPSKSWKNDGQESLKRPLTDLIPLEKLK